MRTVMAELTSKWRRRGHELDFSVGIALGYATLGRLTLKGFVKPMSAFRILDLGVDVGQPESPVAPEADRPAKDLGNG